MAPKAPLNPESVSARTQEGIQESRPEFAVLWLGKRLMPQDPTKDAEAPSLNRGKGHTYSDPPTGRQNKSEAKFLPRLAATSPPEPRPLSDKVSLTQLEAEGAVFEHTSERDEKLPVS